MTLPCFGDIGKKFKDLFTKRFPIGSLKFMANLPEVNGIQINYDSTYKFFNGPLLGNVTCRFPLKILNTGCRIISKKLTFDPKSLFPLMY